MLTNCGLQPQFMKELESRKTSNPRISSLFSSSLLTMTYAQNSLKNVEEVWNCSLMKILESKKPSKLAAVYSLIATLVNST